MLHEGRHAHQNKNKNKTKQKTPAKQILKFTNHEFPNSKGPKTPFLRDDLSFLLELSQDLMAAH